MSLTLIGSGGLFTRIGHLIHAVDSIENQYRGVDLPARIGVIQGDYAASDQNLMDGIYTRLTGVQNSSTAMLTYYRTLAQNTVTQMVNEAHPQIKANYETALTYLWQYLIDNAETVKRNTISTTVTPGGGNRGNAIVLAGSRNQYGFLQEQLFAEDITGLVTRDVLGGASAGQETVQFTGAYGVTDMLHWTWPQGSNGSANLVAVSPSVSDNTGTKNWLTNGMLETFTTPNVPDGWHIRTGTAGTSVLKDAAVFYDGANSVKFVGDGAENTTLWTQFGTDFRGIMTSVDQFAFSLYYKVAGAPAAGVLTVSLVDGSGMVLLDAAGATMSVSASLVGAGTSWHNLSGFLRTPILLPTGVYLAVWLSTPLTAAATVNIDRVALTRPTTFYPGGPQLVCFSGSNNLMDGDIYTITAANAYNGLVQSGCSKLLNLSQYGLVFPSTTGTATILDALVS